MPMPFTNYWLTRRDEHNQPTNQPINQPTNQPTNQTNKQTNKKTKQNKTKPNQLTNHDW